MFCRNCGKELCEKAYVCPACGVLVGQKPTVKTEEKLVEKVQEEITIGELSKKTKLAKLFGILSFCCICVTFLFVFIGIADSYVIGSYYYFFIASWGITTGWIVSWVALGLGITAFIFGLKQKEYATNYISTLVFIASIAAFLIHMFMLIING